MDVDIELSILGTGKNNSNNVISQKNVYLLEHENKNDSIIKIYDEHNRGSDI